jgi:hypothetical protein
VGGSSAQFPVERILQEKSKSRDIRSASTRKSSVIEVSAPFRHIHPAFKHFYTTNNVAPLFWKSLLVFFIILQLVLVVTGELSSPVVITQVTNDIRCLRLGHLQ